MRTISATLTSPTLRSSPGASVNSCCILRPTSASGRPSSAATAPTQKRSLPASLGLRV